ncbi:MAG: dihydrofolate reductase family protein [Pseudomonadota bacterium]
MRIVISAAMSLDGRIDSAGPEQLTLSGKEDLAAVYALRAECDAILIGAGTLRADNPKLLIRGEGLIGDRLIAGRPAQLEKVVLSESGRDLAAARLFAERQTRKWIVTLAENAAVAAEPFADRADIGVIGLDGLDPPSIRDALAARGIEALIVEGGRRVLTSFLTAGLFDELRLAVAPFFIGAADAPRLVGDGAFHNDPERPLTLDRIERFGDVAALTYRRAA